ncbi:outer membrane beta-barrel protein [Sphingomonas changnyeongensis]|uniref:Outer membrane beta-barrel protein n=1 Tax=Sphingomonas changnyeongensis TaxID=2698679 RepID=A0A7Z2NTP1_9SPHN|nr:porin family protein [Sphingomonas changnyeongensis]QHL89660.1 outer membrane beta-barrel protein [Sphingomonas changnyeongensis]
MKKFLTAVAVAIITATPAMAQERAAFVGPRVEALVGYDRLIGPRTRATIGPLTVLEASVGQDGLAYGIGAGYDFRVGRVILGLEAEYADSNIDGCEAGFISTTDRMCASARRDLYVGGRAGVAVAASTLLYVKAGYTNARVALDYTEPAFPVANFRRTDNRDGVRVGVGVEQKLGSNLYAKAEYRYSDYEGWDERHQVLAGLGVRF